MNSTEFKSVFLPIHPLLYRLAFGMLGSQEDAKDAVQDLYCKLCKEGDRALKSPNPRGYCVKMLRNICSDRLRSTGRDALKKAGDIGDARGLQSGLSAESIVRRREDAALIRKALESLPPGLREVVVMRDLAQMEMHEIEEAAGMSAVNARVSLSRGRRMLKEKLMELTRNEPGNGRKK